jgi:hypothetical protein
LEMCCLLQFALSLFLVNSESQVADGSNSSDSFGLWQFSYCLVLSCHDRINGRMLLLNFILIHQLQIISLVMHS